MVGVEETCKRDLRVRRIPDVCCLLGTLQCAPLQTLYCTVVHAHLVRGCVHCRSSGVRACIGMVRSPKPKSKLSYAVLGTLGIYFTVCTRTRVAYTDAQVAG